MSPWSCPRGGAWGCTGGGQTFFFEHGHVAYQIGRDDEQNRI